MRVVFIFSHFVRNALLIRDLGEGVEGVDDVWVAKLSLHEDSRHRCVWLVIVVLDENLV